MWSLALLVAVLALAALIWAEITILRAEGVRLAEEATRLAEDLSRAEGRLRSVVGALPTGIVVHGPTTEILECNPAAVDILGRPLSGLIGKTLDDPDWDIVREDGSPLSAAAHPVARAIASGEGVPGTVVGIRRGTAWDRAWLLMSAEPVRGGGSLERVYCILLDITARKRLEAEASDQILRDSLTGCFNRRYLAEFERHASGAGRSWGCVTLDVAGLKQFNETHGHPAGDAALVRMSRFLMMQVRAGEAVVRLGGDEFAILLTGVDDVTIGTVVQRILREGIHHAPLAFSLGWAAREGEEPLERTMARAEQGLVTVPAGEQGDDQRRD